MSILAQEIIRRLMELDPLDQEGWFLRITEVPDGQVCNTYLSQIEDSGGLREAKERPRDEGAIWELRNVLGRSLVGFDEIDDSQRGRTTVELVRNGYCVKNGVGMPRERHEDDDAYFLVSGYAEMLSEECEILSDRFSSVGRRGVRWWLTMAALLGATRSAHGYVDSFAAWSRYFSAQPTDKCQTPVLMAVAPFSEALPPYPCVTVIRPLFSQMARAIDLLFSPRKTREASPIVATPGPAVTAQNSRRARINARDVRLKQIYKDFKKNRRGPVNDWVALLSIAQKDPEIIALGEEVTKDIIRNVLAPRRGTNRGTVPRQQKTYRSSKKMG